MDDAALHHVTLPVTDLERSRRFYREVLGLREIERPPFSFPGAWYELGPGQLHLVQREDGTLRDDKGLDSGDIHFGVRVPSFDAAVEFLRSQGYSEEADDLLRMQVSPRPVTGFPQIYILDPDLHVIEINAAQLDG
jgi:glyoxylase I family protein